MKSIWSNFASGLGWFGTSRASRSGGASSGRRGSLFRDDIRIAIPEGLLSGGAGSSFIGAAAANATTFGGDVETFSGVSLSGAWDTGIEAEGFLVSFTDLDLADTESGFDLPVDF